MSKNALKTSRFLRLALMAGVGFPFILASNAFAQLAAPAVPAEPAAPAPSTAEVERVVVTGSNIPTAEETGPNPVDTYRPQTSRNWASAMPPTCRNSFRRRRGEPST